MYGGIHELGQSGLKASALASIPVDDREEAIATASARMDGYLVKGGWAVPLTTPGRVVIRAVMIMATYDLVFTRGFSQGGDTDDLVQKRYDEVMAWLKGEVAEGDPIPDAVDGEGAAGDQSLSAVPRVTSNVPRGFTSRGSDRVA